NEHSRAAKSNNRRLEERDWNLSIAFPQGCRERLGSTYLHVEGNRTLLTLSRLELNRITFIEVFNLCSRRQTATVKEDIVTSIIGSDKAITFLDDNLLDSTGHSQTPPVLNGRAQKSINQWRAQILHNSELCPYPRFSHRSIENLLDFNSLLHHRSSYRP